MQKFSSLSKACESKQSWFHNKLKRYRTEKKLATRLCVPSVDISLRVSFFSASHFSTEIRAREFAWPSKRYPVSRRSRFQNSHIMLICFFAQTWPYFYINISDITIISAWSVINFISRAKNRLVKMFSNQVSFAKKRSRLFLNNSKKNLSYFKKSARNDKLE